MERVDQEGVVRLSPAECKAALLAAARAKMEREIQPDVRRIVREELARAGLGPETVAAGPDEIAEPYLGKPSLMLPHARVEAIAAMLFDYVIDGRAGPVSEFGVAYQTVMNGTVKREGGVSPVSGDGPLTGCVGWLLSQVCRGHNVLVWRSRPEQMDGPDGIHFRAHTARAVR